MQNLKVMLLGALMVGVVGVAVAAAAPGQPASQVSARAAAVEQKQEKHPKVDFTIPCAECHKDETPAVVEKWQGSAHGEQSVQCFVCHGDGETEFRVRPKTDVCLTCHAEMEEDSARLPTQGCFGCHNGHSLQFHGEKKGK